MTIRNKSFHHTRLRTVARSALLGSVYALCASGWANAQVSAYEDPYAVEQLGIGQSAPNESLLAPTRITSLSELELILRDHPSLEALNLSARANRQRAEGALGLPDPVVSLQLNNVPFLDPSLSEFVTSNKLVGVSQALPSRAERKTNSLKSLRQATERDLQSEQEFARLRGQLLVYLIEKNSLEAQRNFAMARQSKYDELADIIDIEINAGRPQIYRLAQVDVERTEVSRTLAELEGREAEINAELVNLLGFVPKTNIPSLPKTPWTGNALGFYGVRVADANVDISDADVQRAEADFKADWGVNFSYKQRESGRGPMSNFDGDDFVSGGVTFTIPLWAGKRQEPNLQAAKTDKNAAISRRTAIARQLQSEWSRYEARRKTAASNIRIIEQKITAIEVQTESQLITYEAGSGDYSPILDGEIAILMLRAEIVKEQTRRDQAIAKMNSLLVTT